MASRWLRDKGHNELVKYPVGKRQMGALRTQPASVQLGETESA